MAMNFFKTAVFHMTILFSSISSGHAGKNVTIVNIEAVAGDPVYLPCDISTIEPGDQVLLVLWYREDFGTPIYSVDGRERDFSQAERWSDDNLFANRAYFIADKHPAELGVDHIKDTDQGVYRCRVDFKIAQTKNSRVNLTVIVPPQKMIISDETGAPQTSVVGPFPEGASFTLRCDVFGAKPLPTVTWYRNDVAVSDTSVAVPAKGVQAPSSAATHVRSEIRIAGLGRRDVHSELTCQATNNAKTQPLAATLHVDMNFGPLDVVILGNNQPLSAGRRYDLLCQSTGSRPPATITWWKHGQRLENTRDMTSNDGNTTTSTLSFVPKKEDDGKYLSCRAENKVVSPETIEDGWKLEIHYTPEAKILLGSSLNPDTIREGTDVYFDCIVNAHPLVYKVEWRHNISISTLITGNIADNVRMFTYVQSALVVSNLSDFSDLHWPSSSLSSVVYTVSKIRMNSMGISETGKTLNINVGAGIIISNQSLVLQGISRATAGNYTCVGYNTEGDGESKPFFLNVLYTPVCKPNQTRIYGVAKQERAQIVCQVDANPPDIQFKWTFNNSADSVDVASSFVMRTGTSSVVTYTPMSELDYGTLLCYGTNKIGSQRVPCVFHIIAAGRPDQAHNCTVSNISMTSFSIRCAEGFNGGLSQSFLLEVRESQTQDIKTNLSSPVARFLVTNLQAGVQYQLAIFSYNSKGRSEPAVVQAATLRLPEKQLTAEQDEHRVGFRFTPMMSVLTGVFSALIIVALIVILVLRLQCTHNNNRRKNHKNITGANVEHRRSNSDQALSDKEGGSPISKHESSGGECDSDEKNPDIIPQPNDIEESTYSWKRQHVSTIETSPSRSLLHQTGNPSTYMGYCTLRNGIPSHEFSPQSKLIPVPPRIMSPFTTSTMPRQSPHQWQYTPSNHPRPSMYPSAAYRGVHPQQWLGPQQKEPPIALQALATTEEEPSAETPLVSNKRESTV